jgi:glycosyltransferase involved in cell wall biosynthesis
MPLNVLYLTMNPNRMSTTVPTEGWFHLLAERGLSPVLVSRERGDFDAWAREQGIPTYQNPLPFPDKRRPWRFARAIWQLRQIVTRHEIDLIHCNEHEIYPAGQYLARICRLPVVVSVHCAMQRGFCQWAFAGTRRPQRMLFVSHSNWNACRAAIDGLIPDSNCRVQYNGLDLNRYQPDAELGRQFRREHRLESKTLIGIGCAFRPGKQLEHLIEATARMQQSNACLALAGWPVPGDEHYAEQLIADAKLRLGDRFISVGKLADLRGLYNALDLFVNTSQDEACSITVLEALACGCPIVGYPSGSVEEVVPTGGGEIVAQDDVSALTSGIDRWLADHEQLKAARHVARQRAEQQFGIRALADQLWDDYQEILAQSSSAKKPANAFA